MNHYRFNVAAIILAPESNKVLVAERIDISNAWQFPQGGIDSNESEEEALFRELKEELGTNDVEILDKNPNLITYDFPESIAKRFAPFKGQCQRYFLVRLNSNANINLNTKEPEFKSYKFVDYHEALELLNNGFKGAVYTEALNYFQQKGYLC